VTVLEVIQRSAEFLTRKGVDSPRLQVELLLSHVLKVARLRLYLDFDRQLLEPELETMRQLVRRRANGEPLQHLVGCTSFCGLELQVNGNVLIPRPETEVLAEHAWRFLQAKCEERPGDVTALDFGTGSGCIAIALAHHVPAARVDAVDASTSALEVARVNVVAHQLAGRVQLFHGDGFAALPQPRRFNLIVSNPPYIPSAEIATLAPEVREHDPRLALDGGIDGLEFYRRLAEEAAEYLEPGGQFMAEFGDTQEQDIRRIMLEARWSVLEVLADLTGKPRIVVARRAES
jgi:release factor glutamine methyltransferase